MPLTRTAPPSSSRISRVGSGGNVEKDRTPAVSTAGELFPDGSAVELIRESETGRATLLAFDGENHHIGSRIHLYGRVFEPLDVAESIFGALALPTERAPYGSTRKLFTDTSELISRMTRQPEMLSRHFPSL
jgi:hypothetical protein